MAGRDANITQVIIDMNLGANQIRSLDKTNLVFENVHWENESPDRHTGITRQVVLEGASGSQGRIGVTLSNATVSCRVHISGGRLGGGEKKVQLELPRSSTLDFDSLEIDANREKYEVVQASVPVQMVNERLAAFQSASIQSEVSLFESRFNCTAKLSGLVITNVGQIPVANIADHVNQNIQRYSNPFSYSNDRCLHWEVNGVVEFAMTRRDQSHIVVNN